MRIVRFLFLALLFAGCGRVGSYRARIQSEDIGERILAIRQAGEQKDGSAVPLLVDRLEDEDAAARFFAIVALERITGQRFGYDYGQPASQRGLSVEKWRQYLTAHERAPAGQIEARQSGRGASNSAASEN